MPERSSKDKPKKKRPQDENMLAHAIVQEAVGDAPEGEHDELIVPVKNPAAVELGRRGGLKGGKARAKKLTRAQRVAHAKKAANARWGKRAGDKP